MVRYYKNVSPFYKLLDKEIGSTRKNHESFREASFEKACRKNHFRLIKGTTVENGEASNDRKFGVQFLIRRVLKKKRVVGSWAQDCSVLDMLYIIDEHCFFQ